MPTIADLRVTLQSGLSVVSKVWSYKTKDWVTSVRAADIDNDGDIEVVIGSRDGRVHVVTSEGECQWERVVGSKKWIGSVVGIAPEEGEGHYASVLVGTQDGKVYALDRKGQTISKDRQTVYPFHQNGWAIDQEHDREAFWHSSKYEIRYLALDGKKSSQVIIESEDRFVYTLNAVTGETGWTFPTKGIVSSVYSYDINDDGKVETLVSTNDQHLYVLDDRGKLIIPENDTEDQIHVMHVADVDQDTHNELLLGMDGKVLALLTTDGHTIWRHPFTNRFLTIGVADVDGDGKNEILVGSEDKHLYILDTNGKEIWRHYLGYRISSLHTCDIDNDGQIEVLIGSQDSKVHCWRIGLTNGLEEQIRTLYQELERPSLSSIEGMLTADQQLLLQHLVTDVRPTSQPVTLEQVRRLLETKKYTQALLQALRLRKQKVQALWTKGQIGSVNILTFGDISRDSRREIVVGTDRKRIHAFNTAGQELWSLPLNGHILGVQTGYLDSGRWAKILACSTDNCISIISGVKQDRNGRTYTNGELRHSIPFEEHLTSLYMNASGGKQGTLDIIVGTEDKKIYVYGRSMKQPVHIIEVPHGVRIVSAHVTDNDHTPAIVAGSADDIEHSIYAYTHDGKLLWQYPYPKGRVEALCIEDIDGDDQLEIIVGSQDRNIHVLDQQGELKWRYYLPDAVSAVEICDIDGDKKIEILAGCKDGQLYVFSREGDLLWTYQAFGSILAVRADDIDDDKNVEIVIGSENQIEVVRVVNQRRLQEFIDECWHALQQQKHQDVLIRELLDDQSHLRAFALREMATQKRQNPEDFQVFEGYVKDGAIEVRKALLRAVVAYYEVNPQQAQSIFSQLLTDQELVIKLSLVKHIAQLMKRDTKDNWDDGFRFLQRLARNSDRLVRRAVMRELYTLVEDFYGKRGRKRAIFELLLAGLLEPEVSTINGSEWVRQDAARTLAHFLDFHHGDLIMYINLLITKEVKQEILQRVAYHAKVPFIKHIFQDLGMFILDLDESNVLERLATVVNALGETKSLRYGPETWILYKELHQLLSLYTIEDIAHYQCLLKASATTSDVDVHFNAAVNVFSHLNLITRSLRSYLIRDSLKERVNCLLEANTHLESVRKLAEKEYSNTSLGEPLTKLPDNAVVKMLFKKWQMLITNELYRLGGHAEIAADIQTREGRFETQVVIWLLLYNKGRATADNVHVELLDSDQFDIIGKSMFETEAIFAQDEVIAEFTIRPHTHTPYLAFEIIYADTEDAEKRAYYESHVELHPSTEKSEFHPIPNPYSTGVPTLNMCYGREDDLEFLRDNLTRAAGTLLILHGQRRTGKTTLLFQLVNTPVLSPHIPVLIDMQNESYGLSESKFFYRIALYIAQALKKRDIIVTCGNEEDFEKEPTFTLDRFLDVVENKLENRKLILLIDEFEVLEEQVEKKALAPEVFEYLRSIVQHRPNITLLLCGVHTIDQLVIDYWSVFFHLADHYQISKLNEQGAIHLITGPVKDFLEYEPYAIKKIRQLTADQPFLIHMVCRPLVDYCNEREKAYVTLNDVNTILEEIMEKGKLHFQWLWKESSWEERYTLAILAEVGGDEGRMLSLVEIEEQYESYVIPYIREKILTSLSSLVKREILTKVAGNVREETPSEEHYKISVGLIRSWLRKTKSVKQVLRKEND